MLSCPSSLYSPIAITILLALTILALNVIPNATATDSVEPAFKEELLGKFAALLKKQEGRQQGESRGKSTAKSGAPKKMKEQKEQAESEVVRLSSGDEAQPPPAQTPVSPDLKKKVFNKFASALGEWNLRDDGAAGVWSKGKKKFEAAKEDPEGRKRLESMWATDTAASGPVNREQHTADAGEL
eukprot:TRINITY_DN19911_c0_g1_i1.p1 TRINITY_DN19911_c0_g1~~TRINITY_DN19911_c0_g1_i1.p1  ORF type:complete len:184 (+),score=35.73 TRINITY_DN19911_c0_g1_i1:121-672(+)